MTAHGEFYERVATQHCDGLWVVEQQGTSGVSDLVAVFAVNGIDDVAVLEALVEHHFVVVIAQGGGAQRQLVLAPMGEHHAVDEQRGDEVDQHTAGDDAQALPCGLGAILPRLGLCLEVVGALCLVDHTCDVAVSAQRHPAETPQGVVLVFGCEVLLIPTVRGLAVEEQEVPLATELLGLDEGEVGVEEYVVSAHARVEQLGEKQMAKFMRGYK